MTEVAQDWVTLSTPEFVGWTRLAGVALPYPLSSNEQPYIDTPERREIERLLAARKLDDAPLLATTRAAFAEPRLVVYAVRVTAEGDETKVAAVAAREGEQAVLVVLDAARVSLRTVADTELAAGVVGALPAIEPLATPSVEIAGSALHAIDRLVAASASPRTVRAEMSRAGLPAALIAAQEHTPPGPLPTGLLGAMRFAPDEPPRHSQRSVVWREFPAGALLQVERNPRYGEALVLLTPFSPDALFRAAADAVANVYEPDRSR